MEFKESETKKTLNRMSSKVSKLQEGLKKKKPPKNQEVKDEEPFEEGEEEDVEEDDELFQNKVSKKKVICNPKGSKIKGRQGNK